MKMHIILFKRQEIYFVSSFFHLANTPYIDAMTSLKFGAVLVYVIYFLIYLGLV